VGVSGDLFLTRGKDVFTAFMPWSAVAFISDFDNGKPVEPFAFEIEIPERFLKQEVLAKDAQS
jgi:hypothetical protein